MKPGTIVRLPDGRECTVVYNGLDGEGVLFGRHAVDVDAILASCPLFTARQPDNVPEPEAMLRDPYPGAELPCVGDDYEIVADGLALLGAEVPDDS